MNTLRFIKTMFFMLCAVFFAYSVYSTTLSDKKNAVDTSPTYSLVTQSNTVMDNSAVVFNQHYQSNFSDLSFTTHNSELAFYDPGNSTRNGIVDNINLKNIPKSKSINSGFLNSEYCNKSRVDNCHNKFITIGTYLHANTLQIKPLKPALFVRDYHWLNQI